MIKFFSNRNILLGVISLIVVILLISLTSCSYDMSNISFNDETVTYDGEEHTISIDGNLDSGVAVSYLYYDSDGKSLDANYAIDAGEYTVIATFSGNYSYDNISAKTATLTIEQAEIDATLSDQTFTYDGSEHSIELSNLPDDVTATYVYQDSEGNTLDTDYAVNAGDYTVTATVDDDNYESFETTATLTIEPTTETTSAALSDETVTYDGEEQTIEVSNAIDDMDISYTYEDSEGNILDTAYAVNVGTYTVTAVITSKGGNYETETLTATLTIEQAETTATLTDETVTYDGEEQTIEVSNQIDDMEISYTYEDSKGNTLNTDYAVNVGTYTVTSVITSESGNYKTETLTATLTIEQAETTATLTDKTVTYDGEEQTIEASNTTDDMEISYTYEDSDGNKLSSTYAIDAGIYTVTVVITSESGNYKTETLSATLTIDVATLTLSDITLTDSTIDYDGDSHSLTISGTLDSDVSVSYTYNGDSVSSVTAANSYDVIATFVTTDGNYETELEATLTINATSDYEYDTNYSSTDGYTATLTSYNGSDTEVTVPDTVSENGIIYTVTEIGEKCFYESSITSIDITDNVTYIAYAAFGYCTDLGSITFSSNLTSIGNWCFEHCSSLESITFPSSLENIGVCCFWYCSSLNSVTFEDSTSTWDVTIGSNSTSISVSNSSTNATYFLDTYEGYIWSKETD